MKIIEPGHVYQLRLLDENMAFPDARYKPPAELYSVCDQDLLVFVNREEGHEHAGYLTQDVICALIDRTQHCDACLRWEGNDKIVHHLRMALALHEARALERKVERGELQPELVSVDNDGHWPVREQASRKAHRDVARMVQRGERANMTDPVSEDKIKPVDVSGE